MRPTDSQLATASYDLGRLAYDDDELFHLIAAILDRAIWVQTELAYAKTQTGHRRSSEIAPVGVGAASSVEAQFAATSTPTRMHYTDEMVRATNKARRTLISRLVTLANSTDDDLRAIGYPHRSDASGLG